MIVRNTVSRTIEMKEQMYNVNGSELPFQEYNTKSWAAEQKSFEKSLQRMGSKFERVGEPRIITVKYSMDLDMFKEIATKEVIDND